MPHTVTTPAAAQQSSCVQRRALLEDRDGARMIDVLDTGRRKPLVIDRLPFPGDRIWTLALVHVVGERAPRWIAVERLGAAPGQAPKERGKGAIPGYSLEASERKRARWRKRARAKQAARVAARVERHG